MSNWLPREHLRIKDVENNETQGTIYNIDLIWNVMVNSSRQNSKYLAHVPNGMASRNSFSISIKPATRMHIFEFLRFVPLLTSSARPWATSRKTNRETRYRVEQSRYLGDSFHG